MRRIPTKGDSFSMKISGETFTDRTKASRQLIFIAAALKPLQATKPIGEIGGFPIAIQRLDESAKIIIHGKNAYTAHISETPLGTVSSLEHAITHLDQRLAARSTDLADLERKQSDLAKHLDQPFEYSQQLQAATKRQADIVEALDITKNQAPAQVEGEVDDPNERIGEDLSQSVCATPMKRPVIAV